MKTLCISCTKANLRNARVRLLGTVRQENYTVEMDGLECPNCGYATVEGKSMPEFGRLLADQYRRGHGLLTSNDIVALRRQFGESQEAFAKRLGVGPASIKRWELGKIQDERSNQLILEKTEPKIRETSQYSYTAINGTFSPSYTLTASGTPVISFFASSGLNAQISIKHAVVNAHSYGGSHCDETARQHDFAVFPAMTANQYSTSRRGSHV